MYTTRVRRVATTVAGAVLCTFVAATGAQAAQRAANVQVIPSISAHERQVYDEALSAPVLSPQERQIFDD